MPNFEVNIPFTYEGIYERIQLKRYANVVVGNTSSGHTLEDCDFLCTGTNDHTTISSAINVANAGSKVILLEGTYIINSQINLSAKSITIEGMGSSTKISFTSPSSNSFIFYILNTVNTYPIDKIITFKNFDVEFTLTPTGQAFLSSATLAFGSIVFDNINAKNINGTNTYFYLSNATTKVDNIFFTNCTFENFYIIFYDRTLANESDIKYCKIYNCKFFGNQDNLGSVYYSLANTADNPVTFDISYCYFYGVGSISSVTYSKNSIVNNNIIEFSRAAMSFTNALNLTICNNVILTNTTNTAIALGLLNYGKITNNSIIKINGTLGSAIAVNTNALTVNDVVYVTINNNYIESGVGASTSAFSKPIIVNLINNTFKVSSNEIQHSYPDNATVNSVANISL